MSYQMNVPRELIEDQTETKKIDKFIFSGLLLIIAIMPLIIRAKIIDFTSPTIVFDHIISSGPQGDVFTYYKFMFLLIVTVTIFGLFLYRTFVLHNPLIKEPSQFFFMSFAVIVAASALASPYTHLALFGMYNRHDGAMTTVVAIFLFFIAANLTYTNKRLLILAYAFVPVVVINLIFGLYHFYGVNLLERAFFQTLILPASMGPDAISGGSKLQATINNPNYVSGFASMMAIMYLGLALFVKGWYHKVAFFLLSIGSFVLMLTALSLSGFLALVVSLVILLLVLVKFKNFKVTVPLLAVALTLFMASIYIMQDHNQRVWTETFGLFNIENPFLEQALGDTEVNLESTSFSSAIEFGSKAYAADAINQREISLPEFPAAGITAGSGRGYIWDRTIALTLDRPLLGYGLDTIIYAFPQYELEKQAGLRSMTTMVDKPHNIFIGIAYGSGFLALIAFLSGTIVIAWAAVKHVLTKKIGTNTVYIVVFSLAIVAFLIQGIPNDAIIGVYPLYWILLGVVVALSKQAVVED